MQNSRTKNTLMNTSFAILARIVSMVLGFIQKTIFIRTLGMSYTGVSGLFTDILTMLSLAELGIGSAIAYSLYKPIANEDYKRIAQLVNFFRKAYHAIALIVFSIGLALVPAIPYIVKDVPDIKERIQVIFILYIINSAASYLLVYKNTLLVAAQKQYIVSTVQMVFTGIGITVECILLLVFKNYLLYLIIQIIVSLCQNITINIIANHIFPQLKAFRKETISSEDRKILFRDVRALLMYKIANVILGGTDSTIISAGLGTQQVGIAGSYNTLKGYLLSYIAQFYNSLNPSLGNLVATENKERQYSFFNSLLFGTFWIASVCSICLYTVLNPFIYIWLGHDEWLLPQAAVAINVFEFYLSILMHPIGAIRQANGLFVQTKYVAIIKAVVNLAVSVALVKPLGIMGVWIGTVVSYFSCQLWYEPLIVYHQVFQRSVKEYYKKMLIYFVITLFGCLLGDAVFSLFPHKSSFLFVIIRGLVGLVISNLLIVITFHKKETFRECTHLIKHLFTEVIKKLKGHSL